MQAQNAQPKPKEPRYKLPYILRTDPTAFERQFCEHYDESYLFNEAVTLMYVIKLGEAFRQQTQGYLAQWQGGLLPFNRWFAFLTNRPKAVCLPHDTPL